MVGPGALTGLLRYGGLTVPVLGGIVAKAQGATPEGRSVYAALAAFAAITVLAALPSMSSCVSSTLRCRRAS